MILLSGKICFWQAALPASSSQNYFKNGNSTIFAGLPPADFDGDSGAPISDPARFCWNFNTCRAGGRRSGGSADAP